MPAQQLQAIAAATTPAATTRLYRPGRRERLSATEAAVNPHTVGAEAAARAHGAGAGRRRWWRAAWRVASRALAHLAGRFSGLIVSSRQRQFLPRLRLKSSVFSHSSRDEKTESFLHRDSAHSPHHRGSRHSSHKAHFCAATAGITEQATRITATAAMRSLSRASLIVGVTTSA